MVYEIHLIPYVKVMYIPSLLFCNLSANPRIVLYMSEKIAVAKMITLPPTPAFLYPIFSLLVNL